MNITNLDSLELISKNFNTNIYFLEYLVNQKYAKLNKLDDTLFRDMLKIDNSVVITNMSNYIHLQQIPKKNKKNKSKFREVIEIKSPYNIFHKELLLKVEDIIKQNPQNFLVDCSHGFIKNKNTLSNAKQHINKKYILKVDILNFFNSIDKDEISIIFQKLGCNKTSAELFSKLCTYNNVLKEGFNTSPILANLYCYDLDKELILLSEKYNLTYTRYADDMTFSSDNDNFPSIFEINSILEKYKLSLNSEKTNYSKRGQSQYVTGLSVSNELYPRIPRRLKRKIRQDLYQLDKYFFDTKINLEYKLRQVYGKIVYTIGIEKELGRKYKEEFIKILSKNGYKLSDIYEDAPTKLSNQVFHYIDESEIKINNKHYLALSVVSIFSEEIKKSNKEVLLKLKDTLVTDYRNGLNESQRKKLFHYCEDNIYVKGKYQEKLRDIDFESFLIFIDSNTPNMDKDIYQEKYYQIFSKIFSIVLPRFKNYNNYIYPEENSKISKEKLKEKLSLIKGLPKFNIEIIKKDEILSSIPDYMLGIFGDCIKEDLSSNISKLRKGQMLYQEIKLNEIIDKIRLIIDFTNENYYSRKNKLDVKILNKQISNNTNIELPQKIDKPSYVKRVYRKNKNMFIRLKKYILDFIIR
jgi:RNA-directed DNA polymerase